MKIAVRRRDIVPLAVFIGLALLAVGGFFLLSNTLHAANYDGDWNNANEIERAYASDGLDAGVWISSPNKPYRTAEVDVPYGNKTVWVQIRGSWYNHPDHNILETYVENVTSSDLQHISGGRFSRGSTDGQKEVFIWNEGAHKTAELIIGNVCDGRWGSTTSKKVTLFNQLIYRDSEGTHYGTITPDTMNVELRCQPLPWSIKSDTQLKVNNGAFSASDKTAAPGDMLTWKHALQNVGPGSMNNQIGINVDVQEDRVNKSHYPGYYNVRWKGNNGAWYNTGHLTQLVKPSDAGKLLCQRVAWNPRSSSNSNWGLSKEVCANIPYNYQLQPTITTPADTVQEGEKTIPNIIATITNTGPTISRKPTNYAVIRFVARGAVIPADTGEGVVVPHNPAVPGDLISDWACETARQIGQRYGSSIDSASCSGKELTKQSGPQFNVGTKQLDGFPKSDDVGLLQLKAGDQLCYATTVSTYSQSVGTDTFRYAVKCAKIAKRPKVQIWGGDVRSANQVITSRTNIIDGGTSVAYGSWAEYGIIANKDVRSASGAGLSSGSVGRSSTDVTRLTFANTGVPTPGNFSSQPLSTAVQVPPVSPVVSGILSGTKPIAELQTGRHQASNLRLEGGEIPAGRRVVVYANNATVTIAGDIRYTAAQLNNTKDIPQLVIVAKQIIIEPQVERVDAWLMTTHNGSISTCGAATGDQPAHGLNVAACAKQLRINGPIHTSKLYLRRTYGAENKPPMHFGTPAEILNLRPDAYLWGHGTAFTTGAIRTMYVKELPPRL